jgi:hypothetical protein
MIYSHGFLQDVYLLEFCTKKIHKAFTLCCSVISSHFGFSTMGLKLFMNMDCTNATTLAGNTLREITFLGKLIRVQLRDGVKGELECRL